MPAPTPTSAAVYRLRCSAARRIARLALSVWAYRCARTSICRQEKGIECLAACAATMGLYTPLRGCNGEVLGFVSWVIAGSPVLLHPCGTTKRKSEVQPVRLFAAQTRSSAS